MVIVKGIIFLISFQMVPYKCISIRTDFCILILYPATFLNVPVSSNSLVDSLGLSTPKITSSTETVLLLSFQSSGGKAFSPSQLSLMFVSCGVFTDALFRLWTFPSIPSLLLFSCFVF